MTGDRSTFWLCFFVLALLGCRAERRERTQGVVFEIAGFDGRDFTASCMTISAVDSMGGPLPLRLVDGVEAVLMEFGELRFGGNYQQTFDVRIRSQVCETCPDLQEVTLRIVVYGSTGDPVVGALVEDMDLSAENTTIRLYPFRSWASAQPQSSDPVPVEEFASRALHGAQPVGTDQVLIFGGVSGERLDASSILPSTMAPLPVSTIEVYDGRTSRVAQVAVVGTDGMAAGFNRVLFTSLLVEDEDPETYRIRVIGGYTGAGGSPLVRFDNIGTRAPSGAPFVPSDRTSLAPPVDLVYDPRTRIVTIEDVSFSAPTTGGPTHRSDYGSGDAMDSSLVVTSLAPEVFSYGRGGEADTSRTLLNLRLGPAVLSVTDGFLVWGGNVGGTDLRGMAGELFPLRGASVAVTSTASVPAPTAFHSWTPAGDDRYLIAGGYQLQAEGVGTISMFAQVPDQPIYYLEARPGPSVAARVVSADGYASTILHTATSIDGLGVLLVGGAGVELVDGSPNRLAPQSQVVLVSGAEMRSMDPLSTGRWGHTATPLSGHRLLVVGGFEAESGTRLNSLDSAEVMYWEDAPPMLIPAECEHIDHVDAGVDTMDAGLPPVGDSGPTRLDAGPSDAGMDGSADAMAPDGGDAGVDGG